MHSLSKATRSRLDADRAVRGRAARAGAPPSARPLARASSSGTTPAAGATRSRRRTPSASARSGRESTSSCAPATGTSRRSSRSLRRRARADPRAPRGHEVALLGRGGIARGRDGARAGRVLGAHRLSEPTAGAAMRCRCPTFSAAGSTGSRSDLTIPRGPSSSTRSCNPPTSAARADSIRWTRSRSIPHRGTHTSPASRIRRTFLARPAAPRALTARTAAARTLSWPSSPPI